MKKVQIFTVLTIFLNLLIVIGAGHGIGIIAFVEILGLREIFNGNVKIKLIGTYDERLYTSALISTAAQILLLTVIFTIKNEILKLYFTLFLLALLIFSFIVLTIEVTQSNIDRISFISGIPFLISAFYTSYLAIVQIKIRKGT